MDSYVFEVFKNNQSIGLMSETEVRKLLGPTVPVTPPVVPPVLPPVVDTKPEPVKVAPLAFSPRTQTGTYGNGLKVYSLTGTNYLGLVTSEVPDCIALRGTDLDYTALPNVQKPTGYPTAWYGTNAPSPLPPTPDGYTLEFFDTEKKQPYFKRIEPAGTTPSVNAGGVRLSATHVELDKNTAS